MLKKRWVRLVLYFHLFLLLLLIFIGIDVYRTNVNTYETNIQSAPYQAIIVPGVLYDGVKWSDIMRSRVLWATHLYKTGKAKHIIFSGSDVYTPYIESEVMAAYAEKLGVPKSAISVETRAEHSTENVYYSYKLAIEAGFDTVAVVTDPFQSYFLRFFAKEHHIKIKFLPFQFGMDSIFDVDLSGLKIDLPEQKDFIALPDREDFMDRLKGTLGKHIPRDANNIILQFKE